MFRESFRVLLVDLATGRGNVVALDGKDTVAGGSGLAALLFSKYAHLDRPWHDPEQPLIFAIGPLTGYFPLMSKTVCAFKSPYHDQYAESHGGGRSAFALRFADYDALVITGKAKLPSCLVVGARHLEIKEIHMIWGMDVFDTGKILRSMFRGEGHRSILRIGPAGENGSAFAEINVDTYRHFGRLGGGTVMGNKNLKGIVIEGDESLPLPESKDYPRLFQDVYTKLTATSMMTKYHDIGTPVNMALLNEVKMLPIRNLQRTTDPAISGITGEEFAETVLLRNSACAGCPVGCIHIGYMRERFQKEHRYFYRQVSYDHEPIFATGSMLSVTDPFQVLAIIDEAEKVGLDVMSAGVALAWATEATEKGIISEKETIAPLAFGDSEGYKRAMEHLGMGTNDFYRLLAQGTLKAADQYGGKEFACVLGQEMAGYATGEVYFASQALGLRHSHLDAAGYSYDQKEKSKDMYLHAATVPADQKGQGRNFTKVIDFLMKDEQGRVLLTSMVACLFARSVYAEDVVASCLKAVGYGALADNLGPVSRSIQQLRWKLRLATGFKPEEVTVPQRFFEVTTSKGPVDAGFLYGLAEEYAKAIRGLADAEADIGRLAGAYAEAIRTLAKTDKRVESIQGDKPSVSGK